MRLRDRFFDWYVHLPMQKLVGDRLRPAGKNDPHGVEDAKALRTSLGIIDQEMATTTWAMGETFSMADCAAAPPLAYVNMVMPFGDTYKNVTAYLKSADEASVLRAGARAGKTLPVDVSEGKLKRFPIRWNRPAARNRAPARAGVRARGRCA